MRREDDGRFAPRWRAILEARWRIRLQEVTELSMAYHGRPPAASRTGTRAGCSAGPSPRASGWPTPRTRSAGWRPGSSGGASSAAPRSPRCCSPPRPSPGTAPGAPPSSARCRRPLARRASRPGADERAGSLQVDSALSYLIAFVIPALDAVFPVLPGESAIIALGVATAGSADPRIALLVGCAAAGAFIGDNLCYLLGRRFGPAVQRRFFATPKGMRARAWAERSLDRFGTQLIVVCRFIPGGRTAVTLTCGLTGYPRRRFVAATAVAAVIWALYAFFIGRIGGQAFEDNPWAGLGSSPSAPRSPSARVIEVIRRLAGAAGVGRAPPGTPPVGSPPALRRHAGQVEADHAGQDQGDRDELHRRDRVAEEDHADRRPPPRRRCRSIPRRRARPQARAAPRSAARSWPARLARSPPWARGPAGRRSASGTRRMPVSNNPAATSATHAITSPRVWCLDCPLSNDPRAAEVPCAAGAAQMETVSIASPRGTDRPCTAAGEPGFREQQGREGKLQCLEAGCGR